jgi:WD40 repeat protein
LKIHVFDLNSPLSTPAVVLTTPKPEKAVYTSIAFNPVAPRILAVSTNVGAVHILDVEKNKPFFFFSIIC